ncbi:MAG: phytoene desaturase family protein, partial [Steroidobacter sp.]
MSNDNSLSRRAFLQQGAAATGVALAAGKATAAQKTSATSAKAQYDFVIAGGGHNSMVCAAYLAKAGYKCVVLEAKPVAGGNTATEELTIPGYKHEPCANTPAGLHRSAIKDELELEEKWGLEFAKQQELACVQIQGDGTGIPVWTGDLDRTLAELARFSRSDAERMRKLLGELGPYQRAINTFSTAPIGYAPSVEEQ